MTTNVVRFDPLRVVLESELGGKGVKLWTLASDGYDVPPFICVPTYAIERWLGPHRSELEDAVAPLQALDRSAAELAARIDAVSAVATRIVRGMVVSEVDRRAIEAAVGSLGDGPFAVRSSVCGEDSGSDSFAGQMDSFLWVSREDVAARMIECVASAYSARSLLYRLMRGRLDESPSVAVVVQTMVDSRTSGVVFTADPTAHDRSIVVVSAGLGLGEGIVSGTVEADTFRIDKNDRRVVERVVVEKTHAVRPVRANGAGGTARVPVPDGDSRAPALSDAELENLVDVVLRIERGAGRPQDIEWAIDARGKLFILQTRPITSLADSRLTIFDNANIVESYPGISSPLTFSFVRTAYQATFREAARRFGIAPSVLEREHVLFENLVSLVDGRIYYNLLNWYRLYQLAGMDNALPAWERAMGISESLLEARGTDLRSRLLRIPEVLSIRAGILGNIFALDRDAAAYLAQLESVRRSVHQTDLALLGGHELLELLDRCTRELLAPYAVSVVNDFYAQQLYDLLGKLIERWGLGDASNPNLRNDLVAGHEDLHSVRPLRSLRALVDDARAEPALLALLDGPSSDRAVWSELAAPAYTGFMSKVRLHLTEFGDRTMHELKLETPTFEDEPERFIELLRRTVRAPGPRETTKLGAAKANAEASVRARLAGSPLRRLAFERVLAGARASIGHRENLRLGRTRAFGLVKRIVRALGRLLTRHGMIACADDVFFLTVDELRGSVRGHLVHRDLRSVVALRHVEWAEHAKKATASRVVVRGVVYARDFASPADEPDDGADVLAGLGSSAGVVRAPASVVLDPASAGSTERTILVAPMTDPGWIFLMVSAAGLVVEKGSQLSHTAIIGRELGLPTVVGVAHATRAIRDSDVIEIDGARGTVRIVERVSRTEGAARPSSTPNGSVSHAGAIPNTVVPDESLESNP